MECAERICYVKGLCDLRDKCILHHPLLNGRKKRVYECILKESPQKREKVVIAFMSEKQKMKVRGHQAGGYFKWKGLTGFDPDREPPKKKSKRKHTPIQRKAKREKVGKTMKGISAEVFLSVNNNTSFQSKIESATDFLSRREQLEILSAKWAAEPEPNFHEPE